VIDPDEGDDDNNGSLVIALLQKERRLKRTQGCDLLTIGYAVYKVSRRISPSTRSLSRKCSTLIVARSFICVKANGMESQRH